MTPVPRAETTRIQYPDRSLAHWHYCTTIPPVVGSVLTTKSKGSDTGIRGSSRFQLFQQTRPQTNSAVNLPIAAGVEN